MPVRAEFARLLASGQETGAGLAVIHDGRIVADLYGGWADTARTRPWDARTVVNSFSISKAVIAVALLVLVDRGQVGLDEPVCRYWPEFASHGKRAITVRQALSHQAGLPAFVHPHPAEAAADWRSLTRDLEDAEPEWAPGTAHAEHAWTYGHLVGEIIRRVDGRMPGRFLADEVADPWDLNLALGLDASMQQRAAELEYGDPQWTHRLSGPPGSLRYRAVTNPEGWLTLPVLNSPVWRAAQVPAGNIHLSAMACARLYAGLLAGGTLDGVRLLSADLVAQLSRVHAQGPDLLLGRSVRWGLGVQIEPERGEWGMGGISGSYAFTRPGLGYSFAFLTRRLDDYRRVLALTATVNACLRDGAT
ncbi:beta-lactamase family protein [Streptomyces sp. TRM72054]|uniref:serine hydrolase domain-containing protein n=1 Tax=Streptomyces sp. TRM72054 TaxID=2870562 RepID=UPI001C8BE990|nr:serine hydrolase domain-containing protein [Streptomyces sp. TRM72054]MBX9396162.1 beta-lactamase family protein [Streptomyces sp. TRM72054]